MDLHNSLLFEGVEKKYVDEFLNIFSHELNIKKGEVLVRQNDVGDVMYLLKNGKLEVLLDQDLNASGGRPFVATIESGAVIGEMCVFGQKKRSATITAAENSTLQTIEGQKFRDLIHAKHVGILLISYNISQMLCQRLVNANDFIRKLNQSNEPGVKSEIERYRQRFLRNPYLLKINLYKNHRCKL